MLLVQIVCFKVCVCVEQNETGTGSEQVFLPSVASISRHSSADIMTPLGAEEPKNCA